MLSEDSYTAAPPTMDALMVLLYKLATYTSTHLIDDAAMLAIIFC
jgi:hypothetical protein